MTMIRITIFIMTYLSLISHGQGFEVVQPKTQTVNGDGSVSISCGHNASDSIVDVRLNQLSLVEKQSRRSLLCQWQKDKCHNIVLYEENSRKYLFIMLYVGAEQMDFGYECEFTVTREDDLHETKRGEPTRLLPGPKEAQQVLVLHSVPPPRAPPAPQESQLRWCLIGLLTLMLLYSCVITAFYIMLWNSRREPDINATYVEMRKVLQRGH
ncbi:uncharacterized protein LOC117524680 [Thalassophryne amazonica]|uniref:uncharacterized protein LOC117524680 n=1 Tax=Thalassophryne amazonica TaxID=390379 RepID=UPI0014719176|nr:uncharacterized protein LOC117524680 [Thalassophryne amazonica]